MVETTENLPPLPALGHPENYYARLVKHAERDGNAHAREAAKVGQYLTLALDPNLPWESKLRYFQHALTRHCVAPPVPTEAQWLFYQQLAILVRHTAGQEAVRLASEEDDLYMKRLKMGHTREEIAQDAEKFFPQFVGHEDRCPAWLDVEDWSVLKAIRDQWI
jgi:hypothetical protein